MRQNKTVVGITGGSGCGKSYLSSLFREQGYTVIDADVIGKEVMQKGEACLREVVCEFGEDILENGELNRKKLAKIVFSDPAELQKLNKISHKYILLRIEDMVRNAASQLVFVDGAVLIESGFSCDIMIGVIAEYDKRKERIKARDALSEEEALRRLDAQPDKEFYIENCDFVVYNNGAEFDISEILKRIEEIKSKSL